MVLNVIQLPGSFGHCDMLVYPDMQVQQVLKGMTDNGNVIMIFSRLLPASGLSSIPFFTWLNHMVYCKCY